MATMDAARSLAMRDVERGSAIERRAVAMAIDSAHEFERMSVEVGRKVRRQVYSAAVKGDASDTMFARIEDALRRMEERTGHDVPPDPPSGPLRLVLHNVYGIGEIAAEGGDAEEVSEAVIRLVRKLRDDDAENG